jgi:hypothetical protein
MLRTGFGHSPQPFVASKAIQTEAAPRSMARWREPALTITGLAILSIAYFFSAVIKALARPLWMDEVLGVWVARLATPGQIVSAIWGGGEFSPPTYHLLLHAVLSLPGACCGALAPRLISILAAYAAAGCVFWLLRNRADRLVAVAAFGAVLASGLFEFAIQAREYALLTLLLAVALLIWTGFEGSRRPWARAFGLFAVLFACVSLHFYGVLEVMAIGMAELVWLGSRREFRVPVWTALVLTAAASLLWLPLALHLAGINALDTHSPAFYGRPTAGKLAETLFVVWYGGAPQALILVVALAAVAVATRMDRPVAHARPATTYRGAPTSLEAAILALLALPFAAFAVALAATHAFNARYAIPSALVVGLGGAYLLRKAPGRRLVALMLVPLLAAAMFLRQPPDPLTETAQALAAIRSLPDRSSPIVVGEGLLFIQLMEAADPPTRARLVYVLSPPGTKSPDPTNENQVRRLRPIFPKLPVRPWRDLPDLGPFLLLHRVNTSTDTATEAMLRAGVPLRLVYLNGDTVVLASGGAASR